MRQDIENVDYDSLDDVDRVEYAATLQSNVSTLVLQLQTAKEPYMAGVLQTLATLRLSDRIDLLLRFVNFGQELLRQAVVDKKKEILHARITQQALEEARQELPVKTSSDIPVETGDTNSPILNEEDKEN